MNSSYDGHISLNGQSERTAHLSNNQHSSKAKNNSCRRSGLFFRQRRMVVRFLVKNAGMKSEGGCGMTTKLLVACRRALSSAGASAAGWCGVNASGLLKSSLIEYCSLGSTHVPGEFVWSKQITHYIILLAWVTP